ncbi:thioredoxin-like fold domain-containing protein MRL7L homolog, chloroplastic [Zingiber officinale]|uniref:thioredoxin-like fold domain-containing protein MRL7L homolog, chloroplastic n=1 Tax=Zingiber officinale TaxID=94328 RepID=UPI001C4D8469|nr:thioredoxin-like fold domain-containing protein MRL7L homolog, chloroplastic [Zingiber officinale]
MAAPHCSLLSSCSTRGPKEASGFYLPSLSSSSSSRCQRKHVCFGSPSSPRFGISLSKPLALAYASKAVELVLGDGKDEDDVSGWNPSERKTGEDEDCDDDEASLLMTEEEREEMRRQIRKVIDANPIVEEETDPDQRKIKMKKLLEKYPLVVEEDDPDWPEDSDGRGFNLDQFFNKITIKNVKKDEEDENYDSDKELVWQDDNYIRPIRDITSAEWEDTVFRDFNPLIILVHNRYKRPSENERARNELERAVQMFWQSGLPSPRCVAIDACVEHDLVDALQVSIFPEIIFTKAGKILYRDKVVRSGDDWSKMMAFFYYKAVRPSCLDRSADKNQEKIPSLS